MYINFLGSAPYWERNSDTVYFNPDGSIEVDTEVAYGRGFTSVTLTLEELERLVQFARGMKGRGGV